MFKVYFEDRFGQTREIGEASTKEDIYKIINKFLDKHNFKSYYTREWNIPDGYRKYDVGSHSEFFLSKEIK